MRRDKQSAIRDIKVLEKMGIVKRQQGNVSVKFHKLLNQRRPWVVTGQ
jgi:hypothetical protein